MEEGQSREEALSEAFCWLLGVDGTFGWQQEHSTNCPAPRASAARSRTGCSASSASAVRDPASGR
jgi:hypothetical protein